MTKVTKEPASGISEEERKRMLEKMGHGLRENKQTGEFHTIKKRAKKS